MSPSRPKPPPPTPTGNLKTWEIRLRGGGGQGGLGVEVWGGMAGRVPILQYLGTSITYSYTAGKAVDKSNFLNEISKENYKTNAL
jgi:hypothetical protein